MGDDSLKENDGVSAVGENRGVKRSCSPREIEAKKAKVEDTDTIVLEEEIEKQRNTPEKTKNLAGTTSSRKNTPKLSKEEREAGRLKKAELKRQREEERERAKVERERIAEEKRLERERKEKERGEKRKEEERKKGEKRKEEEEKKEKKKKEEELIQKKKETKRREEEALEEKKRRASARFIGFFSKVDKKRVTTEEVDNEIWYKPFQIKDSMELAPIHRREPLSLDCNILTQVPEVTQKTYLYSVSNVGNPRKYGDPAKSKIELKAKLLQFHDNYRPPYYGTWRKKSKAISGRNPFCTKEDMLDYEGDSDADWEDEPSDAEECKSDEEDDGEDEVDSDHGEFFVAPGYLSDGEGIDDENGPTENAEERRARLATRASEWNQRVLQRKHNLLETRCFGPSYAAAPVPLQALQAVLF